MRILINLCIAFGVLTLYKCAAFPINDDDDTDEISPIPDINIFNYLSDAFSNIDNYLLDIISSIDTYVRDNLSKYENISQR